MKRMMIAVLCAAFVMAAVAPVLADEASHRAAVEKLLSLMKMQENMDKSLDKILESQTRASPGGGAGMAEATRNFYNKYISWAALKDDIVKIYMEVYTEDEVKELVAFHESPIGKKMTEKNPDLSTKIMELTMARMRDHMQELQTALTGAMSKESPTTPSMGMGSSMRGGQGATVEKYKLDLKNDTLTPLDENETETPSAPAGKTPADAKPDTKPADAKAK
jgi:uncharacterized protein